jgi:transcriptional regulator with XRE-family HTH domain
VESLSDAKKVTFWVLQSRLIRFVNIKIKNGDFTERGLARILGISQPQIHNVLKGARKLQLGLADELLKKLDISVLDLLGQIEPPRRNFLADAASVDHVPRKGAASAPKLLFGDLANRE